MGFYSDDDQLDRCERCREYLTGRQERYCSPACRQAAHRARQPRERPPMKPCPLCGELFEVWHPRKRFCDYYDEAGYDCINAQEDLKEAAEDALEARKSAQCAQCAEPAGWTGRGRPRRFCSQRCKQADYRKRRAQQAA
ncbi:hypothetical protein AB0H77_30815 [Streptomyces sp. NPDC050844]|uniref:hypothetical protein n=1 Tax=Streptomyces sp. NPDC050844 TaxID=3155790 RepID=UPI00340EB2FB